MQLDDSGETQLVKLHVPVPPPLLPEPEPEPPDVPLPPPTPTVPPEPEVVGRQPVTQVKSTGAGLAVVMVTVADAGLKVCVP